LTSEETSTPQQEEPSPQPSFSSFFDRLSLLETSRIMTAEKKPETLLSGLLEIFVKSSGATLGYLFLADGTEHFPASVVVAKNRGGTLRTEQVATEENGEPPLSLALKVYRTGETLGLEADHRKEFFNDPYLRRENPKAFYCSPLRHKSSIAGVLFLEHDLHREFFSPDTVEILDILTSQAAVALENFTLYAQLLEKMRRERRLEEENRTHLENLMQAEKMATLGLLTSEIGHEINNMGHPLQLAAGQLEAIERDLTPLLYEIAGEQLWEGASLGGLPITEAGRRLSEIIATIKESSGQIVRLATQLRGYYKEKEQGSASADLNEIVSSTLILASHVINSSTDRFTFTPGDIPRINGNRRRLQQVFLNLIKNGCQSLESRHASLTVSTSPDESGRFVVAEVTDDGKGMEPETLAAAGNPFFTTKGTEEGTGLGLSIVRRIVEEHRAIMEIESEPGKGTTVRLRFPALEAEVRHD
jgi:signal transduction histidine kinase